MKKKSLIEKITGVNGWILTIVIIAFLMLSAIGVKAEEATLSSWVKVNNSSAVLFENKVAVAEVSCVKDRPQWQWYRYGNTSATYGLFDWKADEITGSGFASNGIVFRLYDSAALDKLINRLNNSSRDLGIDVDNSSFMIPVNGFKDVVMPIINSCK